jgi:hypothetical protein
MGAKSRTDTLRNMDGRTKEVRRLKTITADLAAHLGVSERVNPAQRFLVERAAIDILRLKILDAAMAAGTFPSTMAALRTRGGVGSTTERLDI